MTEVEDFYGCYLLFSLNERSKGHTYIGFTVDPNRRINQHNGGVAKGGARRTNNKGPWEMIFLIHGFPNEISALKFEWAWQKPKKSRRLQHVAPKKNNEKAYEYRVRVAFDMLRTGPWKRLPLTIRWLKPKYQIEPDPLRSPPEHMPITYGPVTAKKAPIKEKKKKKGKEDTEPSETDVEPLAEIETTKHRCSVCIRRIQDKNESLSCYHPGCKMISHTFCLAKEFLGDSRELIPVMGNCPECRNDVIWGELIRHKRGCHQAIKKGGDADGDHWADELAGTGLTDFDI